VVLVDSDSDDDTTEVAAQFPIEIYRYRCMPRSAAAGRRIGTALLTCRYVLFLDGDSVLDPAWLPPALALLEADAGLGVVYGRRRAAHEGVAADYVETDADTDEIRLGGNALYRRAALDAAGGFNPWLRAEEEGELLARLRAVGFTARATPALMITHHATPRDTVSGQWRRVARGMSIGAGQVLRAALADGLVGAHLRRFNRYLVTLAYLLVGLLLLGWRLAGGGGWPLLVWSGGGVAAFLGLWLRRWRLRSALYLSGEWLIGAVGLAVGFASRRRAVTAYAPLVERRGAASEAA